MILLGSCAPRARHAEFPRARVAPQEIQEGARRATSWIIGRRISRVMASICSLRNARLVDSMKKILKPRDRPRPPESIGGSVIGSGSSEISGVGARPRPRRPGRADRFDRRSAPCDWGFPRPASSAFGGLCVFAGKDSGLRKRRAAEGAEFARVDDLQDPRSRPVSARRRAWRPRPRDHRL